MKSHSLLLGHMCSMNTIICAWSCTIGSALVMLVSPCKMFSNLWQHDAMLMLIWSTGQLSF